MCKRIVQAVLSVLLLPTMAATAFATSTPDDAGASLQYKSFQRFFASFRACINSENPEQCLPKFMLAQSFTNHSDFGMSEDGRYFSDREPEINPSRFYELLKSRPNPRSQSKLSLLDSFKSCFATSTVAEPNEIGGYWLEGKDFTCLVERTQKGYLYLAGFHLGC